MEAHGMTCEQGGLSPGNGGGYGVLAVAIVVGVLLGCVLAWLAHAG